MTWQPINLAAPEFSKPSEPPSYSGLIYAGKRHLLSGPPEAAKTLLALIFGLEACRAGDVVAIIDFENGPYETRRLLEDLGATASEVQDVMYFEPEGPPDAEDIQTILGNGVSLAIIDALAGAYDASGLDDEKRREVERFANTWIKPLWQQGVATICVDHVVKNHENRGKFSIGSERKLGTVDVHLGLRAVKQIHRGSTGLISVSTHKDRPAHLDRPVAAEVELVSDPITHAISWTFKAPAAVTAADDGEWRPTFYMALVSTYLQRQAEPVNRGTIYKDIGRRREHVVKGVDFLVLDGYARETVTSDGTKLISHLKPFPPVPGAVPEAPFQPYPAFPGRSHAFPEASEAPVPAVPPPLGGTGNGGRNGDDIDPEYLDYLEALAAEMTDAGELG